MKFDSHIFDRIRVKPSEDRRSRPASHVCEWPGCRSEGAYRAPKGRLRENEQWHYCLEHVREYNQSYNFFDGMSEDAVLKYQKDSITGHRPTWKMGTGKRHRDPGYFYAEGADDPFSMFGEFGGGNLHGGRAREQGRAVRNAERKALEALGLEAGAGRSEIKARFHLLVKRHHPDANGGDTSTEDKLVEIIQAYNYLKSAGFC
jgi:hypothetical protein